MRQAQFIKILTIINFLLITLSISIIIPMKNNGYEVSIYSAVPYYFWFISLFNIFLSISIVIYQAYFCEDQKSSWWMIGMSTLMLSNILILLLPVTMSIPKPYMSRLPLQGKTVSKPGQPGRLMVNIYISAARRCCGLIRIKFPPTGIRT